MQVLARLVATRGGAAIVLLVALLVGAALAPFALRVEQDDDVLAFLPEGNAEVAAFRGAAARFGALDVALVGVRAAPGGDVFAPDFVARLGRATKRLGEIEGVENVLSLTSVEDFVADTEKGGITAAYLVEGPPSTPEEVAALRAKVLSRDAVVGKLVSRDGDAVMLYAFLGAKADPRVASQAIRAAVTDVFPEEEKHWGGAPFVSTYVYDVTQRDLRRLSPWAAAAVVLFVLLAFRDALGAALALAAPGFGILVAYGAMGLAGERSNIVLGSMPILLVALGSAYPIHLVSRTYELARTQPLHDALAAALRDVGPVVVASAVTTMAGLASFLVMDIGPMRVFGLYTSLGILGSLLFALFVAPAALALVGGGRHARGAAPAERQIAALARACAARPVSTLGALGIVALGALAGLRGLETRMDQAAFFDAGSEPDLADRFLRERFGGSQFLQVVVEGDLDDPLEVRRVAQLADQLEQVPGVTSTSHVGDVLSLTNEALEGVRRLPDTREKLGLAYSFVAGRRAVDQLVTRDRKAAMILVTLGSSELDQVEAALAAVQNVARGPLVSPHVRRRDPALVATHNQARVADRVVTILRRGAPGALVDREALARAVAAPAPAAPRAQLTEAVTRFLASDEFLGELPTSPPGAAAAVAREVASGGTDAAAVRAAVAKALVRPADDGVVEDVASSLERPLPGLVRREVARAHADALVAAAGVEASAATRSALAGALFDLDLEEALVPGEGAPLVANVTGLPVLYQGLSRSVAQNQGQSLVGALALVLLCTWALFRRVVPALLSVVPTLLTVAIVYGAMGWLHVHLDIGTSMLASLIIGAGVDYGIHLVWSMRAAPAPDAAGEAARLTGPGVLVNAAMVASGFFVLTLGEARPLEVVGGLTAAAMGVAALVTFIAIPALARRVEYRPRSPS